MNDHLEQYNNRNLVSNTSNAAGYPATGGSFAGPISGSGGLVLSESVSFGLIRQNNSDELMPLSMNDDVACNRFASIGSPVSSPDIQTPHREYSPVNFDNNTQNTLCERSQAIKLEDTPLDTLNPESVWDLLPGTRQIPPSPTTTSSIASTPRHDQPAAHIGFKFELGEDTVSV